MQDGRYRPASELSINALISLLNSRHPQPGEIFVRARDSFWRIGAVALKVGSHGAVHIHHRRRGFLARKGSGFGGTWCPAAGPRVQGPAPQTRPLSQTRSWNDVAV